MLQFFSDKIPTEVHQFVLCLKAPLWLLLASGHCQSCTSVMWGFVNGCGRPVNHFITLPGSEVKLRMSFGSKDMVTCSSPNRTQPINIYFFVE